MGTKMTAVNCPSPATVKPAVEPRLREPKSPASEALGEWPPWRLPVDFLDRDLETFGDILGGEQAVGCRWLGHWVTAVGELQQPFAWHRYMAPRRERLD